MKRKLGWFGLGFAGAELAAAILPSPVCVPAAAFLVCAAYMLRKRRSDTVIPLLGALCGLAWFWLFAFVWVQPAKTMAGQTVTCTAVIETDAEASYSESRLRGTLLLTEIDGKPARVRVQCASFPGETAGERFTAKFALETLPDNQYRLSRNSKGVYLQAEYLGSYHTLDASRAPRFALFRLRQRWSAVLRRNLPRKLDGMEAAMLLADKSRLDDSVVQAFRTAGVSHLLAVSGLHLALLCGLLGFGRRWKFYKPLIFLRAAGALFYVLLTGAPVSVLRAGLVLAVALAGDFFLLPVDLLTSTGFAAILLGLQNAYAPCDIGFQLSFCAVLGVQAAAALTEAEQRAAEEKPAAVRLLCRAAEPVQTAALASLATLPILAAHGMAASLVGIVCNVLVVWMLQPALQMGIALLILAAVPFLLPLANLVGLVLSLWLKAMLAIVTRCAALPFASVYLPQRYTLFVLAVLGALAMLYWHAKKLRLYLPAAALCAAVAVGMGVWMQRDVVQINLVGSSNNPCVVCVQNGQAVVFFRGGESNLTAVNNYLAGRSREVPTLVVDLRAKPTQMDFTAAEVVTMKNEHDFTSRTVLDGLVLDLYHNKSASLAVLGVGDCHIAVGAGSIEMAEPVQVDVLCAPGTLSDFVRADTVLTMTETPKWKNDLQDCTLRYGEDTPGLTLRPNRSILWEEAQPIALQ
ncbi:ComEC/Rec2 family competence protein [Gemmiger sp.]